MVYIYYLLFFNFSAQSQDAKQLHETARTFMIQGDHPNAIIVLNQALAIHQQILI